MVTKDVGHCSKASYCFDAIFFNMEVLASIVLLLLHSFSHGWMQRLSNGEWVFIEEFWSLFFIDFVVVNEGARMRGYVDQTEKLSKGLGLCESKRNNQTVIIHSIREEHCSFVHTGVQWGSAYAIFNLLLFIYFQDKLVTEVSYRFIRFFSLN